ncbi:thiamine biosynthesis protein ThiO [Cystobacter fuscus]|uniref:Thiamine biosynthesis protein ThiO n=1 Tax=Cystobacter fuscus TaxID=43 RepID=A0A250J041_9BACT|nr:FAD-dependent oxidoreductase [Cystobacter fuscus]ATB36827.1 thiamine biosynthesis protein ThiO [Cystobacter fuscus]
MRTPTTSGYTILGAGVMGLCTAVELASRGGRVTLVDPQPEPGPHACSWWAGGMLAPFCEGETAEEPVIRLGQTAADWWAAQGVEVICRGTLVLALGRDRAELDRFAARTREHQWMGGEALAALEPELDGRFHRGLFFPTEAHLTPRVALSTLRARAAALGVAFAETAPEGQRIDCRGLAARDSLPELRGVKGEMLVLRLPDLALSRPIRLLHPRIPVYLVPRGGGVYMLGATMIESAERGRASVRSVMELLSAAYALHPAFGEAEILEIGTDARPAFPDNVPRLIRRDGTLFLNGLYRHGYLMAPVLARMAADHLLSGEPVELLQ